MTRQPTVRLIQEVTAEYFALDRERLLDRTSVIRISRPRQVAMYLAREMTDNSTVKIGDLFGGRDHSTVIHADAQIKKLIKTDRAIRGFVVSIREEIMRQLMSGI